MQVTAQTDAELGTAAANQAGRPIRVAHLIHTMAYGGVETALLNWIRTTDQKRFQVSLFCFANPGGTEQPFIEAAREHGISVSTIPWNRRKPLIRASRLFAAELRLREIDVVHCHNTYADLVGLAAARLAHVRSVITVYVWGRFGFVRGILQRVDRFLLPFFDQVTAHCEETLQGTIERGFPASKIKLLPCGFETRTVRFAAEERSRRRRELGASDDTFLIINVARFWPEKAHEFLLEGFQQVLAERPNARLWLLGVGPELERIKNLAREMNLLAAVDFLGFRTDLPEMLALVDMMVHPSDLEGVPLAICAGMAAGLPIVATRVGGLAEVLRHRVSGALVEKRDARGLSRAILDLMNDPDERARLGREAKRFIEDEYSLKSAVQKVENVYSELMAAER